MKTFIENGCVFESNREIENAIYPVGFNQSMPNYREYRSNIVEFWTEVNPNYIPNLGGRYQISTCGRITDTFAYYGKGKIMDQRYDSNMYYQVTLIDITGKNITRKVHRLVMMSFYYFPGCEKYEVNHIDGNHINNNTYNLEWLNSSENRLHAIRSGLESTIFGDQIALLTDQQVDQIRGLYLQHKYSNNQIIDMLGLRNIPGISRKTIEKIVHNKSKLYTKHPFINS